MLVTEPTVYVVDDDPDFVEVIRVVLGKAGLRVIVFPSAEAFLKGYSNRSDAPCCMLLDLQLGGMSGLALLEVIALRKIKMPVVFLTGQANVKFTVSAMKAGALDVLEKPVQQQLLLDRIRQALDRCSRRRHRHIHPAHVKHGLGLLTEREREVMDLFVAGDNAKQVATKLGISPKTAMKHRSHVLEKLQVESLVQLVRLLSDAENADQAELGSNGSI